MRALAAVAALGAALAAPASAFPLLATRPGGTPFEGPTDFEPSAIWWNPGALAGLRRVHVKFDGWYQGTRGSYRPTVGSSVALGDDSFRSFGAATWDFGLEEVAFGVAVYAPWDANLRVRDPSDLPLRLPSDYHLVEERQRHIYVSLAGAVTIHPRWLRLGVAVSPVLSTTDLTFYRDGALDRPSSDGVAQGTAERAQRLQLHGDGGTFWTVMAKPAGLGLGLGVLVNPVERLWLGLSWSHVIPLPYASTNPERPYEQSDPLGAQLAWRDARGATQTAAGEAHIAYALPDVWHLGVRARLRADLEVSSWVRVVAHGGYGGSDDPALTGVVVRLGSTAAQKAGLPEKILLDRGLQPAVAVEVGLRWRPHQRVRAGLSVIYESPAVPASHVSVAAIDAHKVDGAAGLEVSPLGWMRLRVGYAITFLRVTSNPSAFDPNARVRCVDAMWALAACGDDLAGRGLPSAAGRYELVRHHVTAGIGLDF